MWVITLTSTGWLLWVKWMRSGPQSAQNLTASCCIWTSVSLIFQGILFHLPNVEFLKPIYAVPWRPTIRQSWGLLHHDAKIKDSITYVVDCLSKYVFYFKQTKFPKKTFSDMFIHVRQMKVTWHTSFSALMSHTVADIIRLSCVKKTPAEYHMFLICMSVKKKARYTSHRTLQTLFLCWNNPSFNISQSFFLDIGWMQGFFWGYCMKRRHRHQERHLNTLTFHVASHVFGIRCTD